MIGVVHEGRLQKNQQILTPTTLVRICLYPAKPPPHSSSMYYTIINVAKN